MTTTPSRPLRLLRWVLPAAVVLALGAGGALWYWQHTRAPAPVPPEGRAEGLEEAVVAHIRGARERVLREPRSAQAWGTLGEVFLANEQEDDAAVCFAEAERLDPTNPRWPYFQAGVVLNRGDLEGALPLLRRAAERTDLKEAPAPQLRLGETLLILGKQEEAGECFRHVLRVYPDDPHAHYDLGLLAVTRADWPTARTHFERCLGSPSARQKASVQLAMVCRQLREEAAGSEFQQQAERLPRDLDWDDPFITEYLSWAVNKRDRYRRAERLEAAGRYAEAAAAVAPLCVESPDDYLPFLTVGKMLGQTGELDRAEAALRRARHLAPDLVQARYYLSLILFLQGESAARQGPSGQERATTLFKESAELARQALALKPDYGFAHMTLGLALRRLGQRSEAVAALEKAVRCNPEQGELHFNLGEALAEDGQPGARARLERALQLAPPGAPWVAAARERLAALKPETPAKQ